MYNNEINHSEPYILIRQMNDDERKCDTCVVFFLNISQYKMNYFKKMLSDYRSTLTRHAQLLPAEGAIVPNWRLQNLAPNFGGIEVGFSDFQFITFVFFWLYLRLS